MRNTAEGKGYHLTKKKERTGRNRYNSGRRSPQTFKSIMVYYVHASSNKGIRDTLTAFYFNSIIENVFVFLYYLHAIYLLMTF